MAREETLGPAISVVMSEPDMRRTRGLWADAWRRLIKNWFAVAAMIVLAGVMVVAFVGTRVGPTARFGPNDQDYDREARQAGPSAEHWFGTDQLGRDRFARVMEGVQISTEIGLGSQLVVLAIGVAVGASAALFGRTSDNILMRFTDITFAFPALLLIILVRAILVEHDWPVITQQRVIIILSISLVTWGTVARLIRGQMLSLAERDFVIAAQALGASRLRIVTQHMLPNTLGPVIVAITFGIPAAIFAEASLSFIGLGADLSLGRLVSEGYALINRNVWAVTFPAAAIAVLMLCFTFLGDGLRDALDPRSR